MQCPPQRSWGQGRGHEEADTGPELFEPWWSMISTFRYWGRAVKGALSQPSSQGRLPGEDE